MLSLEKHCNEEVSLKLTLNFLLLRNIPALSCEEDFR
jgi:hypothetical protein